MHVVSDGDSHSTHIFGPDGLEIKNVSSVRVEGEAGQPIRVILEILASPVDMKAHRPHVILMCTVCGDGERHRCSGK